MLVSLRLCDMLLLDGMAVTVTSVKGSAVTIMRRLER